MHAVTYSSARANLAETMDRVCDDHQPVIITRNCKQAVVMLSLDDFNSREESSYLLRSPMNAKRLIESIASLESSKDAARSAIRSWSSA